MIRVLRPFLQIMPNIACFLWVLLLASIINDVLLFHEFFIAFHSMNRNYFLLYIEDTKRSESKDSGTVKVGLGGLNARKVFINSISYNLLYFLLFRVRHMKILVIFVCFSDT